MADERQRGSHKIVQSRDLGTGVTRLKAEIFALYAGLAGLVAKVSSIWNRRPTEPAASSDSLRGRTVTVNPESVVVSDEIVPLAARTESPTLVQANGEDLKRAVQCVQYLKKSFNLKLAPRVTPTPVQANDEDLERVMPGGVVQPEGRTESPTPGQTSDVVPGQTTSEVVVHPETRQHSSGKGRQQWTRVQMDIGSAPYQSSKHQRPRSFPLRNSPKNNGR